MKKANGTFLIMAMLLIQTAIAQVGIGTNTPFTTLTLGGSTGFSVMAIANLPSGGSLGTAATTVDEKTVFNVNQTTASQTITIPSPTNTTAGRVIKIANIGTTAFTVSGIAIAPNKIADFYWNGTSWSTEASAAASGGVDGIWQEYPLSFAGTINPPVFASSYSGKARYMVIGKTMFLQWNYWHFSAVGSGAGTGFYQIALPAGYTINYSLASAGLSSNNYVDAAIVGNGTIGYLNGSGCAGPVTVVPGSSNTVKLFTQCGNNTALWGATWYQMTQTDLVVRFTAQIPIN